ncbi:MAG: N-acetylmuramoyl-L-alanine amidase [Bacteroidales bacterium]
MKRIWIISIVLMALSMPNKFIFAQKGTKIRTVVIDAGHGGKDPGASSKQLKEKDVALSVALKVGSYIKAQFSDVKVIYTRKTDKFIPLYERGEIANRNNADLFISIHCNANNSSSIYGAETYVLGIEEKRTDLNMKVAMMENAAILLEEDASQQYGDFDPKSPEAIIGLTLFQQDYLDQSLTFASKVQKQFTERVGRKDRSVHQAGFLVLWKTAMPSVLIELGYLSNPTEAAFLASEKGQVYLASAIYRAFKEYKLEYEKENKAYDYRAGALNKNFPEPGKTDHLLINDSPQTSGLEYRVQFYVSPKEVPLSDQRFTKLSDLDSYQHNGFFKYTSGRFSDFNLAVKHQKKVRALGFSDAFVIAVYLGKRIDLEEAENIGSSTR